MADSGLYASFYAPDPLIAECYFYAKPINGHLSYPAMAEHVHVAGARRVILTHRAARCWLAGAAFPGSAATTDWSSTSDRAAPAPRPKCPDGALS